MPKISVIVPVYNAEKWLNQCLSSVCNQTLKDIEVIAVNDGSTDKSLDILEKFKYLYKSFRIIDSVNNGAGGARNKGLDAATGEYIKFVDADDYLKLDILERMLEIAKTHNVSIVRGDYRMIFGPIGFDAKNWGSHSEKQIVDVRTDKDYIIKEMPGVGNKLIKRDAIGDLRFPEKTRWEDLAVMPIIIANSQIIYDMNESIYNYRMHMNTTLSEFVKKVPNILDIFKCVGLIEQHMQERGLSEEYKEQIKGLYILHVIFRVENVMSWFNFPKEEKMIIVNSIIKLLELKYPDWRNNRYIEMYRQTNPMFDSGMKKLDQYLSGETKTAMDEDMIKANINNIFKNR